MGAKKSLALLPPTQQEPNAAQQQPKMSTKQWKGVAASLALRAPKWFHRRFTLMLQNILMNTPEDWAVQLIIQPEWWENEVMKLHRGMQTVLKHPRIVIVELPKQYWKYKPKQIMTQRWFWEQMVSDKILMFSGNGVLCAHSIVTIDRFDGLDFCGAPSGYFKGVGGDSGTHSIRSRKAMMEAIDYSKPGMDIGSESQFFVSTLHKMNKEKQGTYRLATKNETILFAGGAQLITVNNGTDQILRDNFETFGPSFSMSGTGANLEYGVRESLLQICPEWKQIFPNLHSPHCFGASPNAEKCAASICALKPNRPKQGC